MIHCTEKYDAIIAENFFEASVQVKWSNGWFKHIYIDEEIDSDYLDGECNYYDYMDKELNEEDRKIQNRMSDKCPNCGSEVFIKAVIKDGVLKSIESVSE